MTIILFITSTIIGFFLLVIGAEFFVEGASALAERLHISQLVIGLTIVAMGTSLPETAVSISATLLNNTEMSVGNVIGSNILNILLILGICSIVVSLGVKRELLIRDIPFMLIASVLFFAFGFDQRITWVEGTLMLICFALYVLFLCKSKITGREKELSESEVSREDCDLPQSSADIPENLSTITESSSVKSKGHIILFIFGGLSSLILGSRLAVYGASGLAETIGISQRVIGLTIVALGTSLPELMTSLIAAKKGNADMAIGNIVGSNIYNILVIIGVTALLGTVEYPKLFLFDSIMMIESGFVLCLVALPHKKITRVGGILMLLMYVIYVIVIN